MLLLQTSAGDVSFGIRTPGSPSRQYPGVAWRAPKPASFLADAGIQVFWLMTSLDNGDQLEQSLDDYQVALNQLLLGPQFLGLASVLWPAGQ